MELIWAAKVCINSTMKLKMLMRWKTANYNNTLPFLHGQSTMTTRYILLVELVVVKQDYSNAILSSLI